MLRKLMKAKQSPFMPKNTHISKKHVAHLEQVRRQTRAIQIGAIILIALVVGLVGYGIITDTVLKPYRPVASVNGEWVTVRDFQTYAKFQRLQLISQINQYLQYAQMFGISDPINDQNFVGPVLQQAYSQLLSTEQMGQKVLDAKIDDLLIRQEVKKRNIAVSTAEVEKIMQERQGYYASGTPTPEPTLVVPALPTLNQTQVALVSITPTPVPPTSTPAESPTPTVTATLDPSITPTVTPSPTTTPTVAPSFTPGPTATITPTATPYTLEGYNTALKTELEFVATNADIEESDYRKLFESDAYREKLKEVIVADLKPVQAQVWARHILVDTEEEAKQVLERLNKGEDFGKVAAEVSKDTGSGANGGDLGWFSQGTMVKEFQDVAFTMKVGEISQPVKSEFGYHIIQVLGHEDRPLSTDDFQKFKEQTFTDFLKKLREDSKVETYDLWKEVVPTEPALPPQLEQMLQPQQQPGGLPLQP